MKPILKYRGGKSKELYRYIQYIPSDYNTYIEPFVGGGATYFFLEPKRAIINDINTKLMNFYSSVKYDYARLCYELEQISKIYKINQDAYIELKKEHPGDRVPNENESLYYRLRNEYNHKISSEYLDATLYFFINKTAFSGMIRYSSSGEYNVPFGRYPNLNAKQITYNHYELISRTEIFNVDYSLIFSKAKNNDFIFLDPPYDCTFNDYGNNLDGFTEEDQNRLAKEFKKLKCKTLMIIGKTDLTFALYKDYVKDIYDKSYGVNIRNRFQAKAQHMIITNY